jgi:hypothetical protein
MGKLKNCLIVVGIEPATIGSKGCGFDSHCGLMQFFSLAAVETLSVQKIEVPKFNITTIRRLPNLVPRAMPVRGLGWHWLWGN